MAIKVRVQWVSRWSARPTFHHGGFTVKPWLVHHAMESLVTGKRMAYCPCQRVLYREK